jgi:branched-chain amino acid transport system permease protein
MLMNGLLIRWRGSVVAVAAIALAVVPYVVGGDSYLLIRLTPVLIYGILTVGADLAWGVTGIFTLGQAVFFGIGAYTAGLLSTKQGVTSLPVLLGACLLAGALAGAVLGFFLFSGKRVGALYVGLTTLAMAYAAERLFRGWDAVGAANGIPAVPIPTIGALEVAQGPTFYWVALTLLAASLAICWLLSRSQLGLVMKAIRDDEERAEFFGYRRTHVQIAVLIVSAALAAMAGGLFGLEEGFVSPTFIGVTLSTQVLLWVVLGGRGTLFGPLIAVGLLQLGGDSLRQDYPQAWPILVGALLLICIVYLPGGLSAGVARLARVRNLGRRRSGGEHADA